MLRSIIAVTFGVLIGVTIVIYLSFAAAVTVESDGVAAPVARMQDLPIANQFGVVAVWFLGTAIGAAIASLIGRRWAPSSWIVAATMALFAATNFASDEGEDGLQAWKVICCSCKKET